MLTPNCVYARANRRQPTELLGVLQVGHQAKLTLATIGGKTCLSSIAAPWAQTADWLHAQTKHIRPLGISERLEPRSGVPNFAVTPSRLLAKLSTSKLSGSS